MSKVGQMWDFLTKSLFIRFLKTVYLFRKDSYFAKIGMNQTFFGTKMQKYVQKMFFWNFMWWQIYLDIFWYKIDNVSSFLCYLFAIRNNFSAGTRSPLLFCTCFYINLLQFIFPLLFCTCFYIKLLQFILVSLDFACITTCTQRELYFRT